MDITKFKTLIAERENTDDEWAEGVSKCQDKLVDCLCEDINRTNKYLMHECTSDEFSWISEVFDRIASRTKNQEFISALRFLAEKYPEETETYNIIPFIDSAELQINELDSSE